MKLHRLFYFHKIRFWGFLKNRQNGKHAEGTAAGVSFCLPGVQRVLSASGTRLAPIEITTLKSFKPHVDTLFFAEAKCRLLQNIVYVVCCKQFLGATPPNPCKSNGCGKLRPTFTPSVASAITYKCGLQLSAFYFCNKQSNKDMQMRGIRYKFIAYIGPLLFL